MLSHLLLLINTLVLDHVFNDALHRVRVLEPMLTETHLQPCQITPALQLLPLDLNSFDFGNSRLEPNDLGPQSAITDVPQGITYVLHRRELWFEQPYCLISQHIDRLWTVVQRRV